MPNFAPAWFYDDDAPHIRAALASRLFDGAQRGKRPLAHVVLEGLAEGAALAAVEGEHVRVDRDAGEGTPQEVVDYLSERTITISA